MSGAAARHPSDAQRAEAARGVLERAGAACAAGDAVALAACYAEESVWLEDGAVHRGPGACADRHLALMGSSRPDPPQQHGAKAALRGTAPDGGRTLVVVEVRRDRIIFAAA